jgi:hypothetical protein
MDRGLALAQFETMGASRLGICQGAVWAMGHRHQGGSYEERDTSLCADAQCTVKKNSSTLDRNKSPFVEALFQQED